MTHSVLIEIHGVKVEAVSGGYHLGEPGVYIPISYLNSMSDAEIGAIIRAAKADAEFASCVNLADNVLVGGSHRKLGYPIACFMEEYGDIVEMSRRWAGQNHDIDEMLYRVDLALGRSGNKKNIPEKRRQMGKNRDRIFVDIGKRDGFKCVNCGTVEMLQIDHVVPLILGGDNSMENLQFLCQGCNMRKGEKVTERALFSMMVK